MILKGTTYAKKSSMVMDSKHEKAVEDEYDVGYGIIGEEDFWDFYDFETN